MIKLHEGPRLGSATNSQFLFDVLQGLRASPKSLPSKYFYDEYGSELFELITELPEYYPTRTETRIMEDHIADIADLVGPQCLLVEYGSGTSNKTKIMLDHLVAPVGYVPIDVSGETLNEAADKLTLEYPAIEILPVHADFTRPFRLPMPTKTPRRVVVYFPGSTIGNFDPQDAISLLKKTARLCGPNGAVVLGTDLQKDIGTLEAAYNDRDGITAAFNLNILSHINRELDANFNLKQFEHRAFYNVIDQRIEMHLVSQCRQWVRIGSAHIVFSKGESIHTENSHKFSLKHLETMGKSAGLNLKRCWTDANEYFAVSFFTVA